MVGERKTLNSQTTFNLPSKLSRMRKIKNNPVMSCVSLAFMYNMLVV